MMGLALEDRFQAAAVDLLVTMQDRQQMAVQCSEQQQQINAYQTRLIEGRAIVIALLTSLETEPGLEIALAGRARRWLCEIEDGGGE